jgi:hypothetical protein
MEGVMKDKNIEKKITIEKEKVEKDEKEGEKEEDIFDNIYVPLDLLIKEKKRIENYLENSMAFDDTKYDVIYDIQENLDNTDNQETNVSTIVSMDPIRSSAYTIREQMKRQVCNFLH